MSKIDKNEHRTIVHSQLGRVVVCNSRMHEEKVSDRIFAQIALENRYGEPARYVYLTDKAIDSLIEALNDAKTKVIN